MAKNGTCGSFTTKVGAYDIEVKRYNKPYLSIFEDNVYAFWTCVLKKPINGKRKIWGRTQVGLSAGDRFDRMRIQRKTSKSKEDRKAYDIMWREKMMGGKNVSFIRPSTHKEVMLWKDSHPDQWAFFIKNVENEKR